MRVVIPGIAHRTALHRQLRALVSRADTHIDLPDAAICNLSKAYERFFATLNESNGLARAMPTFWPGEEPIPCRTRAGSGMGKVMAEPFAAQGAKVVCADISGKQEAVATSIGAPAVPVHTDVANEDDVRTMIATAEERFGHLKNSPSHRRASPRCQAFQ